MKNFMLKYLKAPSNFFRRIIMSMFHCKFCWIMLRMTKRDEIWGKLNETRILLFGLSFMCVSLVTTKKNNLIKIANVWKINLQTISQETHYNIEYIQHKRKYNKILARSKFLTIKLKVCAWTFSNVRKEMNFQGLFHNNLYKNVTNFLVSCLNSQTFVCWARNWR